MGRKSREKIERKRLKEKREAYSTELIPMESSIPGVKQFAMGECTIFLAKEKIGNDRPVMHLAISCKSRYPFWDEVLRARFRLLQDGMDVAIFLPKTRSQMKQMENCFHLWQVNFIKTDPKPDQQKG